MFSQACVIPSVYEGWGGCIPACIGPEVCVTQYAMGQVGVYPSIQLVGGCLPGG